LPLKLSCILVEKFFMAMLRPIKRVFRFFFLLFLLFLPALVGAVVVLVRVEENVRLVVGEEILKAERSGVSLGWLKGAFALRFEPSEDELLRQIDEGRLDNVTMLLGAGVSADAVDSEKRTATHHAVQRKSVPILHKLIAAKANVDRSDEAGETPLIQAIRMNNGEMVGELLKFGADANLMSGAGELPLQYAVREEHLPLIELLVESEANVNKANRAGLTPLMVAAGTQNEKVISLLLEKGANLYAKDSGGKAVRDYAAETQNPNIIALLGGDPSVVQQPTGEVQPGGVVNDKDTVERINITRLRGVGEPFAVWSARSGRITLNSIRAPVRNIGAVTAKDIKVTVKAPSGTVITLTGPTVLEPNKKADYVSTTMEAVPFVRKLEAVATCSNCEK
jgi:hypothetical protein